MTISLTVQPRVQREKWSLYWKESMMTKTDVLDPVVLSVDENKTKVGDVLQMVSTRMSWPAKQELLRLEGSRSPGRHACSTERSAWRTRPSRTEASPRTTARSPPSGRFSSRKVGRSRPEASTTLTRTRMTSEVPDPPGKDNWRPLSCAQQIDKGTSRPRPKRVKSV